METSIIIAIVVFIIFAVVAVILYNKPQTKEQAEEQAEEKLVKKTEELKQANNVLAANPTTKNAEKVVEKTEEVKKAIEEVKKVDCKVSDWSEYSQCEKIEGSWKKKKNRSIITQSEGNGLPCPTDLEMIEDCPKIDCKVSDWSNWSDCDNLFQKKRTRTITTTPQYDGKPCSVLSEIDNTTCIPGFNLTSSSTTISKGDPVKLVWNTNGDLNNLDLGGPKIFTIKNNMVTGMVVGKVGTNPDIPFTGSQVLYPTETTTYRGIVYLKNNVINKNITSLEKEITVNVTTEPSQEPLDSSSSLPNFYLTASKTEISKGEPVVLTWKTTGDLSKFEKFGLGITSIIPGRAQTKIIGMKDMSDPVPPFSGSVTVYPDVSTTYRGVHYFKNNTTDKYVTPIQKDIYIKVN